jgi:hypothetical protein
MSSKGKVDLTDNTHRGALLASLIEEVSKQSVSSSMSAWQAPEYPYVDQLSDKCHTARVWKLSNQLKVMAQYTSTLCDAAERNLFLKGDPETCIEGLEWFKPFALPVQGLDMKCYQEMNEYLTACARNKNCTVPEANFDLHRSVCGLERKFTQLLVEQHFPGPFKEYELDVCSFMLNQEGMSYSKWVSSYPYWRESGMYYPLLLAAGYMPHLDHWLPRDVHDCKLACMWGNCLKALKKVHNTRAHIQALQEASESWKTNRTGCSDLLSSLLDRLCILMGVKSNAVPGTGGFCLASCLLKFSRDLKISQDIHEQNFGAWKILKRSVEQAFPPSILSAQLVKPKRDTWGYHTLTLAVSDTQGPVVHFEENNLVHIQAHQLLSNAAYTYNPPFIKECMLHQTSQRVQDVLWRLGELVTHPDVSGCMLHPELMRKRLGLCQEYPVITESELYEWVTVDHVLNRMDFQEEPEDLKELYLGLMETLEQLMPVVITTYFPYPQSVLMWRLDTPSRAILYTGDCPSEVNPYSHSQHHLAKILVNTKVSSNSVGGIVGCPNSSDEENVRDCLKHFARHGLSTHPSNTVLLMQFDVESNRIQPITPVTCTTMAESVACFALTRPITASMSVCNICESASWSKEGIDPRYSEKQLAENGFRFRDWTAMHVGKCTQQSRLASHCISFDCLHVTAMPWIQSDDSIVWIKVATTVYPQTIVTLQGKSLGNAVECRFLHDLRMLPTKSGDKVEKHNCEIYNDSGNSVAVAYGVSGSADLQFMFFQIIKQN